MIENLGFENLGSENSCFENLGSENSCFDQAVAGGCRDAGQLIQEWKQHQAASLIHIYFIQLSLRARARASPSAELATMMGRQRESLYHVHLRRAVVFMYVVQGIAMGTIAEQFGGHPNRDTVSRIIISYYAEGTVEERNGRKGVLHSNRKFGTLAWETLVYIVQEEEQSTLEGVWKLTCMGLTTDLHEP